ncbi:NADPH-dependent FMN reductase [Aureimonas jatrophae]|uniref:Chromate reductase n=1 Tax=Aureimonas jatrophae TaxID=1166073 RepID=A0A1H0GUH8_9HYPH|nr:NAD(P)H-dependent oxidoreductase [Aureimonas jatrophae]MBB3949793.1 chromate reductase [Aureimonas jatrophae]SDO10540.1 chromate reductase [Aureimonas jatrophae]
MPTVAVLVGSLRRESINRKFAEALAKLAAGRLEFRFVELGDLPMYNDDLWPNPPESVLRFKRDIADADAVLFVTPEYNRSFPAVLKNAIDWGTRPYGQNSFAAKPGGLVGTSPGATGTSAGQNHLKSVLNVVDVVLMGQPEVYFTYRADQFAADGSVQDDAAKALLTRWTDRFVAWIERTSEPKTKAQANAG